MPHPACHPRGRLALPLVASLALGLAALPAVAGVPATHAATARAVAHGEGAEAKHAKPLGTQARITANYIIPSTVPSGATVVTNCTSAGPNDLYAALQTSATITFACTGTGPYTIDLGDSFKVTGGEALTIDGSDGGRNDIILTGNATGVEGATCGSPITGHQIFRVDFGSSLTLTNLTLTHGYSAIGGAVAALGTFTADRDIFSANGAHDAGGALDLSTDTPSRGQVSTITNSTFVDNYTTCGRGGAIDVDYAAESGLQQVTLRHDTFTNNSAFSGNGGAIAADNNNAASMLEITDAVFRGNAAYSPENSCAVAAYNLKKACAVLATAVERPLDGGIAGDGGAVDTYNQNMHIGRSLFDSNSANDVSDGGAVYIGHGGGQSAATFVTTIDRTTFVNNYADNVGGAIYDEGLLRLSNDTITENVAGLAASAIYFFSDSGDTLTIAASTINANVSDTSAYNGAAIVNDRDGGNGTLAIGTSIVYDNTTLNEVKGSIVQGGAIRANQVSGGTAIECNGPIQDNGHNLSDYDLTPTTNSCGFTSGTPKFDILVPVGTNIGLGPLGAYGGPTLGAPGYTSPTFTERLFAGSPAIDAVPTTPPTPASMPTACRCPPTSAAPASCGPS